MFTIPVSSILVPVDFSDASLVALDTARGLLAEGGVLHVAHVLPAPMYGSPGVLWGTVDDNSRVEHARKALRKELADRNLAAELHIQVAENAAWELCELAERVGVELIVIPTHGRTGLARFALGSVSERVVRHAPVPTLVLRGDKP